MSITGRTPVWVLVAGWPVVLWWGQRLIASPEERWHLLPAAILGGTLWLRRHQVKTPPLPATVLSLLWLYIVVYPWAPPLVRALCFGCLLAALLCRLIWRRPWVPGVWGCVLLALPTLPSLHFFLGYPWRRWTTLASAELLRLGGLQVTAEGAQLRWAGGVVAVDAPCSGLYMSWVIGVLLVALWLILEMDGWRAGLVGGLALILVLAANALRASALFYLESGLLSDAPLAIEAWHHDAIGLAIFAPACWLLGWLAVRLSGGSEVPSPEDGPALDAGTRGNRAGSIAWGLGLAVALCLPWILRLPGITGWIHPVDGPVSASTEVFPGWPGHFAGAPLRQLPLTPREERFGDGFPGRLGRFHDGRREVLLRWVAQPTRRLHAAARCLEAHGYSIEHRPLEQDAEGRPWSVFLARDADARITLRVREGIRDADGRQWGDVSAWYWAAVLGNSRGPWWSYVVAERQN